MSITNTFDLPKFIERVETLINTQKGSMISNPDYGFDWDLFRIALLTKDTLIDLENSVNKSMSYFTKNNMVSSINATVDKISPMTLQITINSAVSGTKFEIKTAPIYLSSGEYTYVKFFPIQ